MGGEQICGPEDYRMTAASRMTTVVKLLYGVAKRRPTRNIGKAVVLWEETGRCTTEAAGVRVQARRERFVDQTPGRSYFQQGLTATCKDPSTKGTP